MSKIAELRDKIEALKAPPEVEKEALRELSRAQCMAEMSAEHPVIRTFLDRIVENRPSPCLGIQSDHFLFQRGDFDTDHHHPGE